MRVRFPRQHLFELTDMEEKAIINILDVIERKYKMEGYNSESGRHFYEGRINALAEVRSYIRNCFDIERNGMF